MDAHVPRMVSNRIWRRPVRSVPDASVYTKDCSLTNDKPICTFILYRSFQHTCRHNTITDMNHEYCISQIRDKISIANFVLTAINGLSFGCLPSFFIQHVIWVWLWVTYMLLLFIYQMKNLVFMRLMQGPLYKRVWSYDLAAHCSYYFY